MKSGKLALIIAGSVIGSLVVFTCIATATFFIADLIKSGHKPVESVYDSSEEVNYGVVDTTEAVDEAEIVAAEVQDAVAGDDADADVIYLLCNTFLDDEDVRYLPKSQIRILRNTIYAVHGRRFRSRDLQQYFKQFDWYRPYCDEVDPSELNIYERHNIELLSKYA